MDILFQRERDEREEGGTKEEGRKGDRDREGGRKDGAVKFCMSSTLSCFLSV